MEPTKTTDVCTCEHTRLRHTAGNGPCMLCNCSKFTSPEATPPTTPTPQEFGTQVAGELVDKAAFLQAVAASLDYSLNSSSPLGTPHMGFAVFIFPTGQSPTQVDYVSNCQREQMVNAIRQWLDRNPGAKVGMNTPQNVISVKTPEAFDLYTEEELEAALQELVGLLGEDYPAAARLIQGPPPTKAGVNVRSALAAAAEVGANEPGTLRDRLFLTAMAGLGIGLIAGLNIAKARREKPRHFLRYPVVIYAGPIWFFNQKPYLLNAPDTSLTCDEDVEKLIQSGGLVPYQAEEAICRGGFVFRTACGSCPKCADELKRLYSFCETVTSTGTTPWHIRPLTEKGKKLSGGADTVSLCGRKVAWGLESSVDLKDARACRACVRALLPEREK